MFSSSSSNMKIGSMSGVGSSSKGPNLQKGCFRGRQ